MAWPDPGPTGKGKGGQASASTDPWAGKGVDPWACGPHPWTTANIQTLAGTPDSKASSAPAPSQATAASSMIPASSSGMSLADEFREMNERLMAESVDIAALLTGKGPATGAPASREAASHPAEDGRQAETREFSIGTPPSISRSRPVVSPAIGRIANSWRRRRDAATSPACARGAAATACAPVTMSSTISSSLASAAEPPVVSMATLEGHGGTVGDGGRNSLVSFFKIFVI